MGHLPELILMAPEIYRLSTYDGAGEMLGTLLEASRAGQSWPSFRDARALVTGGLRVRGWAWHQAAVLAQS